LIGILEIGDRRVVNEDFLPKKQRNEERGDNDGSTDAD
jgi:hypothetical protein